jgi:Na+/H+ antiporter NhaC
MSNMNDKSENEILSAIVDICAKFFISFVFVIITVLIVGFFFDGKSLVIALAGGITGQIIYRVFDDDFKSSILTVWNYCRTNNPLNGESLFDDVSEERKHVNSLKKTANKSLLDD